MLASMRIFILISIVCCGYSEESLGHKFASYYKITAAGIGDLSAFINNGGPGTDGKTQIVIDGLDLHAVENAAISDGYVIKIYTTANLPSFVYISVSGGIAGLNKQYGPFAVDDNGVLRP